MSFAVSVASFTLFTRAREVSALCAGILDVADGALRCFCDLKVVELLAWPVSGVSKKPITVWRSSNLVLNRL